VAALRMRRTLAAVAATGLIITSGVTAAHQTARAASPVTLTFWMGSDTQSGTQDLINGFNKMEAGKIKVVWQKQSTDTGTYFSTVQRTLQAKGKTPDVFGGDVIWPAQLAGADLLLPLDKYFSTSQQNQYLSGPIQDVHYKGHIYGAPWFTDYGLIYYRTDLLQRYHLAVPTSWEQMQSEAKTLVQKKAVKEGFVFQGDQYEGLVCNALEYITGAGGYIYGPKAASTTAQAAKGLTTMRSMLSSGAAPSAVSTYQEPQAAGDFANGQAAFLRNWPYMWAVAGAKSSKVAGKVGVLPMLHEPGQTGYSTLGGWTLLVNKYTQHPDESWQFIKYMTSFGAQKQFAIAEGHTMALKSTYDDPQVVKANPWFKTVIPKLSIQPRPTSPVYNSISLQMQKDFHGVLTGSMQPSNAVSDIESYIKVAEARFH